MRLAWSVAGAVAAVAMVAGATGDSAPRPDPEIFVGYSTKEVGYVLSEELGRLIKSQEHRPANKQFTMAVSGGSLPKLLGAGLHEHASEFVKSGAGPGKNIEGSDVLSANWKRVVSFYADERMVPLDHKDSNHAVCQEKLWSKLPVEKTNIHPIDPSLPVAEAAAKYSSEMVATIEDKTADGTPIFDLILLGMGPDGHTASLFPGHSLVTKSEGKLVAAVTDSPKPPAQRITLTMPVLKAARNVWFVVTGSSKEDAVMDALSDQPTLPAGLVKPTSGNRAWFLDSQAAAELKTRFLAAHRPVPHPKRRHFNGEHEDL